MASRPIKFLCFVALVLAFLGTHLAGSQAAEMGGGSASHLLNKIDCPSACVARCAKASRHKMCLRACNTCCRRCSCVPPGTSGNRDVCPCYAKMRTHGGRLKCP